VAGRRLLDRFLHVIATDIVAVTPEQAEMALEAFRRFGKGRHRPGLNIGDCFAYAAAKATGQRLLFKGDDFTRTDILPALSA
jgi:ribonuclease VapC